MANLYHRRSMPFYNDRNLASKHCCLIASGGFRGGRAAPPPWAMDRRVDAVTVLLSDNGTTACVMAMPSPVVSR